MSRSRNQRCGGEAMVRLAKLARTAGWTVKPPTGKIRHFRWISPAGVVIISSKTASDRRTVRNLAAELRRAGLNL